MRLIVLHDQQPVTLDPHDHIADRLPSCLVDAGIGRIELDSETCSTAKKADMGREGLVERVVELTGKLERARRGLTDALRTKHRR